MRTGIIKRKTKETDISLELNIDGKGISEINTGCGFLDHMLTLFASHGLFDLNVSCKGDCEVDYHHTSEDIGIALGQAFLQAMGDKKGIARYGDKLLPMDEALILSAVDISGRGMLVYDLSIPTEKVGDFDTELVKEFFIAFANNANITLHLRSICGENSHHIIEGAFKSVARSLAFALAFDERRAGQLPSTKGVL
ncbi:MAG: imidazoleglycerol-phosphate dehydratase HisB [Ruminococcaceae bacterium]|nr:imidazoleglycerol-phosphate dehydratase HisB [Oscillospiraceae bacterium]